MEPTLRISGLDFARGLVRCGHRMTGNSSGFLLLERGPRAVTVPLKDELEPALVHFLLLASGVSMPQLVAALRASGDAIRAPMRGGATVAPPAGITHR